MVNKSLLGLGLAGAGALVFLSGRVEGTPQKPIIIKSVSPEMQENNLFWTFKAVYENVSDETRNFSIIMQVKAPGGRVIDLQERRLSIAAESQESFDWNFIFLEGDRGNNTIEFFVWDSLENPIVLSNVKRISLP